MSLLMRSNLAGMLQGRRNGYVAKGSLRLCSVPHGSRWVGMQRRMLHATDEQENVETVEPLEASANPENAESSESMDTSAPVEEEMGLVGQIIAWGILLVLFGASIFFTFSRQFLPDLVPLDVNNPGF